EGGGLEEHADGAAELEQLFLAQAGDALAGDADVAAVRVEEPDDVAQQHALPRSRWPHDDGDLPGGDLAGDPVEDRPALERLVQVRDLDHVLAVLARRWRIEVA